MNTIRIKMEICSGCKTCVRACFVNAIRWDPARKKPVVAYPEDCVHCNFCELYCPGKCITVTPDFGEINWAVL